MQDLQPLLNLLIVLALGHFLADYPLQGDRMAVEKCPGCGQVLSWRWWMTSHAATHGFLVACLTGVPLLGLAEMGVHIVIDLGKCKGLYRLGVDQALHLVCKLLWVLLIAATGRVPAWLH